MTTHTVPDHPEIEYHLVAHDADGRERDDDPAAPSHGGLMSEAVRSLLREQPVTDVFFTSHGWKGDVPAAIRQYDDWIGAMADCTLDRARAREIDPDFRALIVGLHWPSLPWGDEDLNGGGVSFGPAAGTDPLAALVEDAASSTADSDTARAALRTIFGSALDDLEPVALPPEVVAAYRVLFEEMELAADGPAAAPGDEGRDFDPEERYRLALEEEADVDFGVLGGLRGGVLSVLRQLSFWKMKKRARTFGESGAATLLRTLQADARQAGRDVRFHLMGHSFGCIVASAAIAGPGGDSALETPVDSAYLVQGALSYWAYCSAIPVASGKRGYFHSIPARSRVRGPLVTTQSEHDTAVGRLYPLAAGLKRQVSFEPDDPPKYGALGTFGVRGPDVDVVDGPMLPDDGVYDFAPGRVFNLESSGFINEGGGLSGAHNDIGKTSVAHAFWAAVHRAMDGSS